MRELDKEITRTLCRLLTKSPIGPFNDIGCKLPLASCIPSIAIFK